MVDAIPQMLLLPDFSFRSCCLSFKLNLEELGVSHLVPDLSLSS